MNGFFFKKKKGKTDVLCYVVEQEKGYLEYNLKPQFVLASGRLSLSGFIIAPKEGINKPVQKIYQIVSELNSFIGYSQVTWIEDVMFEVELIEELQEYIKIRKLLKI